MHQTDWIGKQQLVTLHNRKAIAFRTYLLTDKQSIAGLSRRRRPTVYTAERKTFDEVDKQHH